MEQRIMIRIEKVQHCTTAIFALLVKFNWLLLLAFKNRGKGLNYYL
jgi:hypothetical protein